MSFGSCPKCWEHAINCECKGSKIYELKNRIRLMIQSIECGEPVEGPYGAKGNKQEYYQPFVEYLKEGLEL
jgi:hypothetical protein